MEVFDSGGEEEGGEVGGMAFDDGCEEDVGGVEVSGGVGVECGGEVVAGAVFEGAGFGLVGCIDVEEDDGVGFAFDPDAVDKAVCGRGRDFGEGVCGADEAGAVVLGEAFEAAGEVDGVGDDGAVEAVIEAGGSEHDRSGVYADADGDWAGEFDGRGEVEGGGCELKLYAGLDGVLG